MRDDTAIFESTPEALIVIDAAGCVVRVNALARQMFGGGPAVLPGQPVQALVPAFPLGSPGRCELVGQRSDGARFPVELRQAAIDTADGPCIVAAVRDLSELRQAERASRQREEHLRTLVDEASDGIFISDAQGRFLDVNPAGAQMFGWTREEMLAKSIADLVVPEEVARIGPEVHGIGAGAPARSTWRFRRKDGSVFHGEVHVRRLQDDRLLSVLRDVSEREHADEALRRSEMRLNEAQALAKLGSWELDLVDGTLTWSAEAYRIFELAPSEFGATYEVFVHHVHPDDRVRVDAEFKAAVEGRRPYLVEHRIVTKGGRIKHVRERGRASYDADGRPLRAIGTVKDITDQLQMQQSLRESEARLSGIIGSALDAIISLDAQQRVVVFNAAAEAMFGVSAAEAVGSPLDRFIPPRHRASHRRHVTGYGHSGRSARVMGAMGQVSGQRADGEEFPIEASISRIGEGPTLQMTAIVRDVTERLRTERELTELTRQLMEQEKATTQRLAQQLHDQLGQTLTAMRIDFVAEAALPDADQAARHRRVDRLIDEAMQQVRQVLTDLRPTLLDERGLVEALDNELSARQGAAGRIVLQLDAAPVLRQQRWGANVEYAAFMVAREAVGNALRHAGATEVRVLVQGDAHALHLQIVDDGVGMPPEGPAVRPGHLGMVGMRERSIAIGARFEVHSRPDEGTRVSLSWSEAAA